MFLTDIALHKGLIIRGMIALSLLLAPTAGWSEECSERGINSAMAEVLATLTSGKTDKPEERQETYFKLLRYIAACDAWVKADPDRQASFKVKVEEFFLALIGHFS
jgi:hypothetical protein